MNLWLFLALGLIAGGALTYLYFRTVGNKHLKQLEQQNEKRMANAEKKVAEIEHKARLAETKLKEKELEAKNKALEIMDEAKKEEQAMRRQLEKHEQRLMGKEDAVEKKSAELDQLKVQYKEKEDQIKVQEEKVESLYKEQEEKLAQITNLSQEEARQMLLDNLERDYKDDLVSHYKKIAEEIKEESTKEAKDILVRAIQKYASDVTSESTQTIVQLPSDDIKGRIIGKEGRNINAFEHLTGVDVIVDDSPGAITVSGFDLVRRYVAKRAMEKLIEDGRIHPARIESVVEETKEQVGEMMKEFGEKAIYEMGLTGIHPDLIKITGRLRFRTSFGQNVLKHSMEVGFIAEQIAHMVGADAYICKAAGFFHDIGKAVDHDIEGSHAMLSGEILRKYNVGEAISHAAEAHHEEVPLQTLEAFIVQAADAVSAARPGARKETVETYIKRLAGLEAIGTSFEGVKKAYAIQAGREVRVFVKPDEIDDLAAIKLSHEVARKIEAEMSYPGTIKVNVIRETRAVDMAK